MSARSIALQSAFVVLVASSCGSPRAGRGTRPPPPEEVCTPAGPLPVNSCGPATPSDIGLCAEDVDGCTSDADCARANLDPCCGLSSVAVLATRLERVERLVGGCPSPRICPACVTYADPLRCLDHRCQLVPPPL